MEKNSKREKWYHLMQDYERSGKSATEWCADNGCTYHMFRYWRYRVRIQETYECRRVELPKCWIETSLSTTPKASGMIVRVGAAEIDVEQGFDRQLLRELVECLS